MANQKPIPVTTIVISIFILFMAFGAGFLIKKARTGQQEPVVQEVQQTDVPEVPKFTPKPEVQVIQRQEPIVEVVDGQNAQDKQSYTGNNRRAGESNNQSENQVNNQREDAQQWMSWFGNLPQEERQQLMRGTMISMLSLVQRWQNMPQEEVQAERAKLQELIQGWRNLPSEDRQQGIQNIQQQIEQWMQNNQQN
jgi:hypothetical protein